MAVCLAWSLNSARWVLGRPVLTSFLPYASAGRRGLGLHLGQGRLVALAGPAAGAVFAALLLPIMVGGVLLNGDFTPGPAFVATANSTVEAYLDLAFRGLAFTEQYGHFMLILGILCWGTGQFTSYAVFGHHRPFNAVMISGLALVLNMSITRDEQLGILIWFSLAALFLLIRLHALDERSTWLRHRLGDAGLAVGDLPSGGQPFIVRGRRRRPGPDLDGVVGAAQRHGRGFDRQIAELTHGIEAVFRGGGAGPGSTPSTSASDADHRRMGDRRARRSSQIKVPDARRLPLAGRGLRPVRRPGLEHHRPGRRLRRGRRSAARRAPSTIRRPATDLGRMTFTVHALARGPATTSSPPMFRSASRADATLTLVGSAPDRFAGLDQEAGVGRLQRHRRGARSTTATDPAHGLTENQLRRGRDGLPGRGPRPTTWSSTRRRSARDRRPKLLAGPIQAAHPEAKDPYDISKAIEAYLKTEGGFRYEANVQGVDWLHATGSWSASPRRDSGYCEYYASTMVVLLRMEGIPARMAEGYLPSQVDANGVETIPASAAHAWVEVYFPRYGWITFDPTGGNVGQADHPDRRDRRSRPGPTATPRPASLATGNGDPRRTIRRRIR